MTFEEMAKAVEDATFLVRQADSARHSLAKLLVGRLRESQIPAFVLSALKRELSNWDIHRKRWK